MIEPREWRDHEIDLMKDDDGCWYMVDVCKSDFGYWLDKQQPPTRPKSKPVPVKRAKIKAFLAKKFSRQRVPDDYVRKDLLNELRGSDPLLKQTDDATFKTAIGEYHDELNQSGSST